MSVPRPTRGGSARLNASPPQPDSRRDLGRWLRPGRLTPIAPDEVVLPLPRQLSARDWLRRAALWAGLLVLLLMVMRWDLALVRLRLLLIPGEPPDTLRQTLQGLREFGQPLLMIVAAAVVYLSDRRRMLLIATLLLGQLLGAGVYHSIKYAFPRYRPETLIELRAPSPPGSPESPPAAAARAEALSSLTAHETWLSRPARKKVTGHDSFPSGHSGSAFAFAAVMAWFYPHLAAIFWTLACGCAVSRCVDLVHWPSDCVAGALIGYVVAWMALRPYAWVLPVILWRRWSNGRRAARRRAGLPEGSSAPVSSARERP